jgi:type 1 fimbria pilin
MLRKSLFPTALLLSVAAIAATTSAARAADVSVPFKGTVAAACEFGTPESGTLTANSTLATQLSSKNEKGQSGLVTVKCNTPATVYVRDYKQTSGQKIEVKATYTVSNGKEEETKITVGTGETQIQVNLTLDSETTIPAGDYSYDVIITATP